MNEKAKLLKRMTAVILCLLFVVPQTMEVWAEEVDDSAGIKVQQENGWEEEDEVIADTKSSSNLPVVNEAQVTARIMDLAKKLKINEGNLNEGTGIQFTVTQKACGHATNNAGNCTNCKNTYVLKSDWFKQTFGYTVDVKLLPGHYTPTGSMTSSGWTCVGFANFALWYIAKDNSSSDVYRDLIGTRGMPFTRESLENSGIRIGDIIRIDELGHSVMFLSYGSNNDIKVLDCNWVNRVAANIATVKIHTISFNSSYKIAITRARNYQPD